MCSFLSQLAKWLGKASMRQWWLPSCLAPSHRQRLGWHQDKCPICVPWVCQLWGQAQNIWAGHVLGKLRWKSAWPQWQPHTSADTHTHTFSPAPALPYHLIGDCWNYLITPLIKWNYKLWQSRVPLSSYRQVQNIQLCFCRSGTGNGGEERCLPVQTGKQLPGFPHRKQKRQETARVLPKDPPQSFDTEKTTYLASDWSESERCTQMLKRKVGHPVLYYTPIIKHFNCAFQVLSTY